MTQGKVQTLAEQAYITWMADLSTKGFVEHVIALAKREAFREAATIALKARCERGTPWDLACVLIANKLTQQAEEEGTDD